MDFNSGYLADPTDFLANKRQLVLEVMHVPSKTVVKFKAFITQFDDQYQTEFSQENVFGRMDSIQSYRGTTRQINLSWDVPSSTLEEGREHMQKCSTLMNMLYPVYSKAGNSTGDSGGKVLSAPPVFKLKFANLIANTSTGTAVGTVEQNGLFGTISGFSYSPDFESGFFIENSQGIGSEPTIIPQTISLSCTFTVIHTHDLGWKETGEQANKSYPYGLNAANDPFSGVTDLKPGNSNQSSAGKKVSSAAQKKATKNITGGK